MLIYETNLFESFLLNNSKYLVISSGDFLGFVPKQLKGRQMHRRTALFISFLTSSSFFAFVTYHLYMSLDTLGRKALIESGDYTYYAPVDKFDVALRSFMISAIIVAIVMGLSMIGFYFIMRHDVIIGVTRAQEFCSKQGCDNPDIIEIVNWHGYDWSVRATTPDGGMLTLNKHESIFDYPPYLYN